MRTQYTTLRIRKDTAWQLKILAAYSAEPMGALLARLIRDETLRRQVPSPLDGVPRVMESLTDTTQKE
jgi:hypothetical protein